MKEKGLNDGGWVSVVGRIPATSIRPTHTIHIYNTFIFMGSQAVPIQMHSLEFLPLSKASFCASSCESRSIGVPWEVQWKPSIQILQRSPSLCRPAVAFIEINTGLFDPLNIIIWSKIWVKLDDKMIISQFTRDIRDNSPVCGATITYACMLGILFPASFSVNLEDQQQSCIPYMCLYFMFNVHFIPLIDL